KNGRLQCASAWYDIAVMMDPPNVGLEDPCDIVCGNKVCDGCDADPIRGPYFTCTVCEETYDLCLDCYSNTCEDTHIHDSYLKVPSSSYPIPSFECHLEMLCLAMQEEIL